MNILMVCLGNICRSPLAEGILAEKAAKAGLAWFVDSAGTSDYHIGEPPHPLSQKVSLLNGIDISTQRCRQFVENDLMKFDKIYAMDSANYLDIKRLCGKNWQNDKVKLILEELHPGKNMEVPDPWYGGEDGFHQVFKLLDDACERIIQPYTTALK
jgi:protein-tyrosine phosphatase